MSWVYGIVVLNGLFLDRRLLITVLIPFKETTTYILEPRTPVSLSGNVVIQEYTNTLYTSWRKEHRTSAY